MKRLIVGVMALVAATASLAEGPGAVRRRVEASMLLTGSVTVAPDGSVSGYELDRQDKVPPEIVELVRRAASGWRFEPVVRDGQPVSAKARMSLRVVARRDDPSKADFTAHIAGGSFGDDGKGGEEITYADRHPPSYPSNAAAARVEGTVYLMLRIDHDGKVVDAIAEQVNMGVVGSDSELRVWRNVLAKPSVQAAKTWTFHPPTKGPHANDPYYVVRVPVVYALNRNGAQYETYGEWHAYVPGPKEHVPWADEGRQQGGGTDAVPDGQLFLVNSGLTLTTPIDRT
ncbi:hypothetical protein SAMN02800694_3266 [Luteibacter sp. UNCMF331Sha3.1]|uniref:hypothetical protein n=1 Tax=Luteibacter sp. UNCMF331Sha3.1 TaxID=1502760 RepID=UPI0008B6C633|nr:hypothetical protein [Luteibacter sp. UNCMF331Sha3.1]SEN34883.1 hypothetical protein SAMN02800694_3266 [Luteibacter sp. UNCMF331Sha3.1]